MKKDIRSRIYNAQCIGNVEPIEYMTPYPSMRSLMEGQTIKFSDQVIIEKFNITNLGFFSLVQQTSNWLESIGVKPRQRVIIPKLTNPSFLPADEDSDYNRADCYATQKGWGMQEKMEMA